jgi:hypothetical protein
MNREIAGDDAAYSGDHFPINGFDIAQKNSRLNKRPDRITGAMGATIDDPS